MEPRAIVASGCRHRGLARGAVDPSHRYTDVPGHRQFQRRSADRPRGEFNLAQFCACLRTEFRARVDAGRPRPRRACVRERSVVTPGDLV